MEIEMPASKDFTIYSKSSCINCRKIKDFLKLNKQSYIVIDCDDYLFEDKEFFLSFIKNYTKCDCKLFPIVFHNGQYIGGYDETTKYVDKLLVFNFECE
jgi:glutaredoxin